MNVRFTITGPPRTKKNHGNLDLRGSKPRLHPSKPYQEWDQSAQMQLAVLRAKSKLPLPIAIEVNITALFYRKTDVGDAVGFYQALADTLQNAGVILNDRQITTWDGSRLRKDARAPRVEVLITEAKE